MEKSDRIPDSMPSKFASISSKTDAFCQRYLNVEYRQLIRGARLMRWFLPIILSLGCSVSSAQIEPNAGKWKTWVLTSGDQLRLPPPPDEAATRAEIAQLKDIAKQRDAGTLDRIVWWNAGPPGYRWTSIAIPPGPTNASLHSRNYGVIVGGDL